MPPRAEWSELQRDPLELILEKLDLADHARFASVCSSWRWVAVENPPINKPLSFVLSEEPEYLASRFITSFIPSWDAVRFIGALDGWLVVFIDCRDLYLLNRGFNSIIPLPPPPKPWDFSETDEFCKAVLSSPPEDDDGDCTVVINHETDGVFYCRLGSEKPFTKLSNSPDCAQDILFYKERLYVISDSYTITIFDHLLNKVSQLATPHQFPYGSRLLISENKILAIFWRADPEYIFAFEGSKQARVVQVNNIGDNVLLLVNLYCPLSISTKDHKEFRRTYYFEDDFGTFVLDTGKDPNKAEVGDPWPLFFIMFNHYGIKSSGVKRAKT